MKRIGLLSDTHNFLDENVFRHFEQCDEVWHAGDFGLDGGDQLRADFGIALALRLYRSPLDRWLILACTWVGGCAIALVLRAAVTGRSTPIAFIIVAYIFIGATTFGWRLLVHGLARVRTRRSSSARVG